MGNVDLGIITIKEEPIRFRSLAMPRDQYSLVVNSEHHLHTRETVHWEELSQEDFAVFQRGSNTYETIASVCRTIGMF